MAPPPSPSGRPPRWLIPCSSLKERGRVKGSLRPPLYRLAVTNPPGAHDSAVVNSADWRAAEIPTINGHGTARAVAGFYNALATGGLLSPGMLAEAVTPQCAGPDRVFGHDNAWGLSPPLFRDLRRWAASGV